MVKAWIWVRVCAEIKLEKCKGNKIYIYKYECGSGLYTHADKNGIYFIARGEINVYSKWIKMIFSYVKEYDIFTSEK